MMMTKISMKTECTQEAKTKEKNKNTITRDEIAESTITHKSNSDITTNQVKGKRIIAAEPGTKRGKGKRKTGKSPKEIKQTRRWNPGQ